MSPDDSDPDHGEGGETGRSGAADAGDESDGQPRDPETGQFLPKDRRGDADGDDADDSDGERERPGTDRDGAATPPGASGSGSGSNSDAKAGSDRREPGSEPGQRVEPGLRITRAPVGRESGLPAERSAAAVESVLPPSLHLVPMQVQFTGEPVRRT